MLRDYLRYMDDFDDSRRQQKDTDPAPPPDDVATLPAHQHPTLPEGPSVESVEDARVKSDVRAKRERKTTVKAKKSRG